MPTWYNSRVLRVEDAAPNVRRFWVEIPELDQFDFKAGQFVTMDLPLGEKRLQRWRSYSIANAPDGSNVLEFCVVRSATGDGTRYLFEEINPGCELRLKGPDGGFVLPDTIERDLVLICTGTGVAPFRSMILDLNRSGRAHCNIHLIFGTREASGILYRNEFESLAQSMPGFRYDIALSRQADWLGHRGHIHAIYQKAYREVRPDVAFYLCGWSNMIDDAVANLIIGMGYERGQVFYELYG